MDAPSSSLSSNEALDSLAKQQFLAEKIKGHRRSIVALDERRQRLREADRSLLKADSKKTYVCVGPTLFLKCPTTLAREIIQTDMKTVDSAVRSVNKDLSETVDELTKLEGSRTLSQRGFDLKPISE